MTGCESDCAGERAARAAWSGIAEPGDAAAGLIVQTAGAVRSLELVQSGCSALDLCREIGLVDPAGTGSVAQQQAVELVSGGVERWRPRIDKLNTRGMLRAASLIGAEILCPGDAAWPSQVDDLGVHAPLALWVRGNPAALTGMSVAMVGARASTGYGEFVTMEIASELASRGITIVSGGAYGIDGAAHRAALASDKPTVAVLAGGVDRLYPAGHSDLLRSIAEAGCLVSELPCGASPTRWRFLQRNRCIAAIANATVVVEAGWRSGSLNTASHAATLGRPLGAVPGPITAETSRGCHRIIRDREATLVTSADDVVAMLPSMDATLEMPWNLADELSRTPDEQRVLDALSVRLHRPVDDVARRAGLSVAEATAVLGRLELAGQIDRGPGGWKKGGPVRTG